MSLRSRFSTWWRAIRRSPEVNAQIEDELCFHVESYADDLVSRGVPREEAYRRARAELGSLIAARENTRQAWGTRAFDELFGDIRYALRMLAKTPGFTAIAIGSLALGIGANTAVFSVAKHALLDRLDVPHSRDLVLLEWTANRKSVVHSMWGMIEPGMDGRYSTSFSYPVYQTLRSQNRSLEDIFAFKDAGRMNITVDGQAEVVQSELVSGNYYQQLEVKPQLGRAIGPEDDAKPGISPVVVISDAYWTKRFGRSPSVIGKAVTVNFIPMTIVGVNPRGFNGAKSVQSSPEIFAPLAMEPQLVTSIWKGTLLGSPIRWWLQMMARRKPGISEAAAQAQLTTLLHNAVVATMHPKSGEAIPRLVLTDGSRGLNETGTLMAQPICVLLAMTGLVLLLACANIANLLLARSSARQREMSVRLALGAGRARILRQVLTESVLLGLCGGVLSLAVALAGRQALLQFTNDPIGGGMPTEAPFSWGVFAFSFALSVATGLLFGIAPAIQSTRTQVRSGLQDNAHTVTRRRRGYAGKAIVGFQIAISMLLVAGAGIFLRSLVNLNHVNVGFDTRDLALFGVAPSETRYSHPQQIALYDQIEQHLAAIPGIQSVTAMNVPFLANSMESDEFIPTDRPKPKDGNAEVDNIVGDDFFSTLRIPILTGRAFDQHDTSTSLKVAIINQALAKKFWPTSSPIGRTFTTSDNDGKPVLFQIVGVCANTRYADLRTDPPPAFFVGYRQAPDTPDDMTFAVRSSAPLATLTPSLRRAVQSLDRDLPLADLRTQSEQIESITISERLFADLTGGFGLLALVLACIGIYGVMAYSVSQRTNEIGIRMALGARASRILRMVLAEASWMAFIGIAVGLGGGLALTRLIASMLYGLKPWDPVTFCASALLLLSVALGASLIPARRAASIDPMRALRHE